MLGCTTRKPRERDGVASRKEKEENCGPGVGVIPASRLHYSSESRDSVQNKGKVAAKSRAGIGENKNLKSER